MDKQQIPYFIDFAPAYLHTTGELHKKNIQKGTDQTKRPRPSYVSEFSPVPVNLFYNLGI